MCGMASGYVLCCVCTTVSARANILFQGCKSWVNERYGCMFAFGKGIFLFRFFLFWQYRYSSILTDGFFSFLHVICTLTALGYLLFTYLFLLLLHGYLLAFFSSLKSHPSTMGIYFAPYTITCRHFFHGFVYAGSTIYRLSLFLSLLNWLINYRCINLI